MSKDAPALDRCLNRAGKGPRHELCSTHARILETKGTLPHGTVPQSNAAGAAVSPPSSESSPQENVIVRREQVRGAWVVPLGPALLQSVGDIQEVSSYSLLKLYSQYVCKLRLNINESLCPSVPP